MNYGSFAFVKLRCSACKRDTVARHVYKVRNPKRLGRKYYDYFQCNECRTMFIYPMPTDDELNEIYSKVYGENEQETGWGIFRSILAKLVYNSRNRSHKYFKKRAGNLLDVGCGTGEFLAAMKKLGWSVFGVEVSPPSAVLAKKRVGHHRVYVKTLNSCSFPENYFDVVTLWHVLEHVKNPMQMLREIYRILKVDGVLLIELPNLDSLALQLFREEWSPFSYHTPEHLFYCSRPSLDSFVRLNGFHVTKTIYPLMTPLPLEFSRSLRNHLTKTLGPRVGRIAFFVSSPLSIFISSIGNYLFGKGEILRVLAHKKVEENGT